MTDSEYPWRDESRLYELYWEQELSTVKNAVKLGCTQQTVSKWMQRFEPNSVRVSLWVVPADVHY
jgi:hypothetical protein